jgi:hypothetical protein
MISKTLNNNLLLTITAFVTVCLLFFSYEFIFSGNTNSKNNFKAIESDISRLIKSSDFELLTTENLLKNIERYKSRDQYFELKRKLKRYEAICLHVNEVDHIINKLTDNKRHYSKLKETDKEYQDFKIDVSHIQKDYKMNYSYKNNEILTLNEIQDNRLNDLMVELNQAVLNLTNTEDESLSKEKEPQIGNKEPVKKETGTTSKGKEPLAFNKEPKKSEFPINEKKEQKPVLKEYKNKSARLSDLAEEALDEENETYSIQLAAKAWELSPKNEQAIEILQDFSKSDLDLEILSTIEAKRFIQQLLYDYNISKLPEYKIEAILAK